MSVFTSEQEALLAKFVPNYKDFDDLGDVLSALGEKMESSLNERYEGTDETTAISILYDEIYLANAE